MCPAKEKGARLGEDWGKRACLFLAVQFWRRRERVALALNFLHLATVDVQRSCAASGASAVDQRCGGAFSELAKGKKLGYCCFKGLL